MKKSELKQLIQEVIDEMNRADFLKKFGLGAGAAALGMTGGGQTAHAAQASKSKGTGGQDKKNSPEVIKIVEIFSEMIRFREQFVEALKVMIPVNPNNVAKVIARYNNILQQRIDDPVFNKPEFKQEKLALMELALDKNQF